MLGGLALSPLKGLGMLAAEPPGSERPGAVRREMDIARRKEVELSKGESEVMMEEVFTGVR